MKRFSRVRLDKSERTQQGFIKSTAYLTRTGVFLYRKPDGGILRELRHPDDVFKAESLATLKMVPLTDDHPQEFVTPENAKDLSIGWIGDNVGQEGNMVAATVVVADKNAIAKTETGKVELSCGYSADLVDEQGIFEGQPYDVRQTNIRYNHVALVDRGRAGPQVKLHLDAADAVEVEDEDKPNKEVPVKIKIGDKEFEVSQDLADAFGAFEKQKNDEMEALKGSKKDSADLQTRIDSLSSDLKASQKETETLKAKLDVAEEKLASKPEQLKQDELDKMVAARTKVLDTAQAVLGSELKADGKSNMTLMKEVVKKAKPSINVDEKSDTYIEVMFDSISEAQAEKSVRAHELGTQITDTRKEDEFDSTAARSRATKDAQDAWKADLAVSKK